ncbi:MAG TPA: transglycosylase SLT domain-containing protein [Myxococcales bacterium]|nr:transglycosylase SLT domain-containing protein [Myxococcales bacterium]
MTTSLQLHRALAGALSLWAFSALAQPAPPPQAATDTPAPSPAAAAAQDAELHRAPEAAAPEAEKAPLLPGFVAVPNPAFPPPEAPPPAPPVNRGRRFTDADFQPHFVGPLAEAKKEFDLGHYARARKLLLALGDANPVRYLRGVAALRAGDAASAAPELLALAASYPEVRDRCLTHAAIAYELASDWERAADAFAQVAATSRLYVDARFGLSRVRARQGNLPGAIAALDPVAQLPPPLWGRDVAAEALIATAELRARLKDRDGERQALTALWARHPLSQLASLAARRLGGAPPPLESAVTRAEILVESHRNQQGMAVLDPLLPKLQLPSPLGCKARFIYGKALRKERLHTRAIQVLQPVVDACAKDPDLRARAMYVLGSSRSIVDVPHGPRLYEQLAADYPTHPFADDALFYAADLYVKSGNLDAALQRLDEVGRKYPQGDFASEALFKAFWIHRQRKDQEKALKALDQIEKAFADAEESYDVERAQYWRARMKLDEGKKEEAADLLERGALEHPGTYYGLLSRSRLDDLDHARFQKVASQVLSPQDAERPWPLYAGPIGSDPHFVTGVELVRLGFGAAASEELLAVNRAGLPVETTRLLVLALASAGDQRAAHAIARVSLRRDLSGKVTPKTRPIWEVAYPNAFRDLIERHCKTQGLDPDLLQALMREESALDPKALSWAGALGLTQLMPGTARAVGKQLGLKSVSEKDLLMPDLNIRLGATLLGSLVKKYSGNKAPALAAYNAGAFSVDHWLKQQAGRPLDEWVEEIPIAETRGYVKRVLRTYNTYELLYRRGVPVQRVIAKR